MRERMRAAGYDAHEIQEEMSVRRWAFEQERVPAGTSGIDYAERADEAARVREAHLYDPPKTQETVRAEQRAAREAAPAAIGGSLPDLLRRSEERGADPETAIPCANPALRGAAATREMRKGIPADIAPARAPITARPRTVAGEAARARERAAEKSLAKGPAAPARSHGKAR